MHRHTLSDPPGCFKSRPLDQDVLHAYELARALHRSDVAECLLRALELLADDDLAIDRLAVAYRALVGDRFHGR